MHSRQARDVMDQMAQVLELLARQQTAAAPPVPVPVPAPVSPRGVQSELESPTRMAEEEDALSISASWNEDSFPTERLPQKLVHPRLSSMSALIGRAANFLQVPWATAAEPRRSMFRTQAEAPALSPSKPPLSKCVDAILAPLRLKGIRVMNCLDDWMTVPSRRKEQWPTRQQWQTI
ncbi:UNVERIFIED_CONTAM: hypothetical protein FKN15_049091 [Acipenser sinensis]